MSILQTDSEVFQFGDSCAAMASEYSAKENSFGPSSTTGAETQPSSYSEETQGYDVDFDPPLESKYECPICLMALREPVQTPCGHRFCKECILKSIRDAGHKCPVDNEMLLESNLFPDNFAKREILSLTVKCPNEGCRQKMELRQLEAHQLLCEFACVECLQCQQTILKNALDVHLASECPKRQVSCPNCHRSIPFDEQKEHDQNCPLANVYCEYCNIELIREQMPGHYVTECPLAPINCSYSCFGCTVKMQRNEEAHHLQDYTQFHMRMMAAALRSASFSGMSQSLTPVSLFEPLRFEPGSSVQNPVFGSALSSPRDCIPEVQNFRETIQQLEGRLVRQDHQIRELIAKMETQSTLVTDMKRAIRGLEDKVAEVEAQQCNGIFVWKIERFGVHLKDQEEERAVVLHSPGFYTGKPGYKLCLRLHLQLPNAQRCANYLSLFVHTMQGEYDSHLPWPFQGTIRLSVLDQSEGPFRKNLEEVMDTKPDLQAFQRPTTQRNPKGFGYVTFMPLNVLKNRAYVKDDTLLVRCEVMPHHDMNSLRREGLQPRTTDVASP